MQKPGYVHNNSASNADSLHSHYISNLLIVFRSCMKGSVYQQRKLSNCSDQTQPVIMNLTVLTTATDVPRGKALANFLQFYTGSDVVTTEAI